jgi:hypothetical protein
MNSPSTALDTIAPELQAVEADILATPDRLRTGDQVSSALQIERGRQLGLDGPAGPDDWWPGASQSVPLNGYDPSGLGIYNSADRGIFDNFGAVAMTVGVPSDEFRTIAAMVIGAENAAHARQMAYDAMVLRNWPDRAINALVKAWDSLVASGGAPSVPSSITPAAAGSSATPVGDRLRAIEATMYLPDGRANPLYFSGGMEVEYRALLERQQRGER